MRTRIEIKKVSQEDLALLKNALGHHSTTLQFCLETMPDENFAKDFSITVELWYLIDKKAAGQFPAKKTSLKLSLHNSFVLLAALRDYGNNGVTPYEKSRCSSIYQAVDSQMPTYTQLTVK